jgi:hypothetical protein
MTIRLIVAGGLGLFCGGMAGATTYYVSSSLGNDLNAGTSLGAAWQTLAHVNSQTLLPGDSVLLRRGDVWNESLVPPSSGTSGSPIAFDAYGTGSAPNLTGYYAIPATGWTNVTGNAWKAAVPTTFTAVNFCLFGSVWGQKVAAVTSNLTAQWDFYLASGHLYVYSVGNPATYYNTAIVPMALSNVPVINVNGQSWLTFQHLLVNWFDQYGVYVQGASDHIVFANMEADSMIPQGTQPLGFYVDESAPGPGDIKIYNAAAHMNYDGFRFDGAATAITMINDAGYANRDAALADNTGAVTFSYCHFYASSLAVAGSTDVLATVGGGPTAGAGNIAADTAPAVQAWERYPAEVTLTVDDEGMTPGADTYYAGTVLPVADAAGAPVGAAITVGYAGEITPMVAEIQGWIDAGRDVTSHSVSHTYYTNTNALDIQYTGSGTAATLAIGGKTLTITVTGAADSVSYNLAQGAAEGTIKTLRLALLATGNFTATEATPCQGPYGTGCSAYTETALLAQDLADVSGQDVRSSAYAMQLDVTRLTTDEITLSRAWMLANLTGLPSTPVYVYPGGYEQPAMETIAAGVPYSGARGALHEGGADNTGLPETGVKDTYASGFNIQNITSFGVNPSWMGLAPAALNQKINALLWKQRVWGVPWGIFWHLNELTQSDPVGGTEITNLIQDFQSGGATIRTNTGLVNWLLGGTLETGTDGNSYYKFTATSMTLDFRPTASSPVVDAGQNLGTAYEIDINGLNQNSYGTGWEIGAHAFVGYSSYGGGSGSYFDIGSGGTTPVAYAAQTGTGIVQPPTTAPNMGGLVGAGICQWPADFNLQVCRLTDAAFDPSRPNLTVTTTASGSGDTVLWNTNSTMLAVQNEGSRLYPLAFDPINILATRLYPTNASWSAAGGFYLSSGSAAWSYTDPMLMYTLNGTQLQSYDFTGYNTGGSPPVATTIFDFTSSANCLGSGYAWSWNSFGEESKYPADQVFVAGMSNAGAQDTGSDVVAYKVGGGCSHLNTLTGAVTGDWGLTGTVGIADRFHVHNVKISKDGQWAMVAQAGCATTCNSLLPYFWQIGTTNLYDSCTTGNSCSGHWTDGTKHLINANYSPFWQEDARGYGNNIAGSGIIPGLPLSGCSVTQADIHQGWSNVDFADTYPFFATTAAFGANAQVPGSYNCAWVNEVLGIAPTSGTVYRFAHTEATGANWNFDSQNAIGGISQDGRFYAFTSDWRRTLGTEGGANGTCTDSPNSSTACRSDVFVVGLAPPPTQGAALPQSFFGMHINRRGTGYALPTIPFGGYRTIDSFGTLWNGIETSNGVYDFTRLDPRLTDAQTAGVDVLYTIYATPTFHSSNPTDSSCSNAVAACDPPSDVNADGSGTDASFIAFLTALVNHVGSQIEYYEVWNEANISSEWTGTNAQLVRMAQDARNVIQSVNPRARMLSPSFAEFTFPTAGAKEAAYLATAVNGSTGSQAADIINFHGYTLTPALPVPIPEYEAVNLSNLRGDLTSTDLGKPMWDTEWGTGTPGLSDPDMDSAYIVRHMLIDAGLNIARTYYYDWDSNDDRALWTTTAGFAANCLGSGTVSAGGYLCETGVAYQQAESWLEGAVVPGPCSGPLPPATGVWTCGVIRPNGAQALAVWDTSQTCSGGSCTTSTYGYDPRYTQYFTQASGSGNALSGGAVQVGAKPVFLSQ